MKQKIWITLATYIAYCIDKELYKAIEYLKVQVEVLDRTAGKAEQADSVNQPATN